MEASSDQLRTLAAVVDTGTFEAAAASLHVTPSAVSQRIKALEEQSGRVLLRRSKPVSPTEAGGVLLRLARQVALLGAEAAAALDTEGRGRVPTIPLVVNADSLATWVLPALAGIEGVAFDVVLDDQEHTLDRLRDGTAMAAIGSDADPVQGCTVAPLGSMLYRATASPSFVERWCPAGWTREAADHAPMLVFNRKDALQDRYLDRFADGAHPPRHYVPASADFVRAAELGLGWGMLPDLQTAEPVREGRLIVLDDTPAEVRLYWHQWALRSSTLDAVAASVKAEAATALEPPTASREPGRARRRSGQRSRG